MVGLKEKFFKRSLFAALAVALSLALIAFVPSARAQQPFPSKPIRLIVPFSAGGGDAMARKIALESAGAGPADQARQRAGAIA